MIMFFVTYNRLTGEITNRIACQDETSLLYEAYIQITEIEFFSKPEVTMRVDLETSTLVPK